MDFFQQLFLESPIRLGVFSFAILSIALFARRRYIDTFGRKVVPATASLIVALFAIQYFVTTDREEVLQAMDEFVATIESNDTPRIEAAISDQYESEGMARDDIAEFIRRTLGRIKIYDTRFHRRDVTVQGDRAETIIAARATVSIEGGVGEMHWGSWRIDWGREAGAWRIISLRPLMLDAQEIRGMKDLRGVMP